MTIHTLLDLATIFESVPLAELRRLFFVPLVTAMTLLLFGSSITVVSLLFDVREGILFVFIFDLVNSLLHPNVHRFSLRIFTGDVFLFFTGSVAVSPDLGLWRGDNGRRVVPSVL